MATKQNKKTRAYYFATKDKQLRYGDGRKIEVGETHSVNLLVKKLKLCKWGLHASIRAIDALYYAPGPILYIVELSGEIDQGEDKICAEHRTYIHEIDASNLLKEFARKQALINIEQLYPYITNTERETILNWLNTGEDKYRSAAISAIKSIDPTDSTWYAAWYAAWYATESYWYAVLAAYETTRLAVLAALSMPAIKRTEHTWHAARYAAWSAANEMLEEMIDNAITAQIKE